MSQEINSHLIYQVLNAPIREYPFPHFFNTDIFPEPFYAQIMKHMPAENEYKSLIKHGLVTYLPEHKERSAHRNYIPLSTDDLELEDSRKRDFWQKLTKLLTGPEFIKPLLLKFGQWLVTRFGEDVNINYKVMIELIRDSNKWALGPHTDHPDKISVILLYLPKDDASPHLGTSVYTPKDPGFTCNGGPHYRRNAFNCASTLPFLSNSAFGFCKNDISFHGVENVKKANDIRNLIQLSVLKLS